ncbi:MAG: Xaa-Pro aminopeptidase [Bacillales bacterium]|nr:Xaa-Pro aminopeptidase [Bacillales bacterium]
MNNYQNNRLELEKLIEDNSLVVLYSGALKQTSNDENYPFKVNMNFFYLTGINQDNAYLMIEKVNGKVLETLFIYENDPLKVRWIGAYLYPNEASEISGIEHIEFVNNFETTLEKKVKSNKFKKVYLDLERIPFDGQVNFGNLLKDKVNAINFSKLVVDIYPLIVELRGVKKPYEIELYKEDVKVTNLALQEVLKRLPTLEYEYQAQGVFEGSIKYLKNARTSFDTIAASGKNAAVLHYRSNNAKMNKEDLLLLDLGAEFNMYHADISRTYPISGKFNDLQRKIYTIVLNCNKHIISLIKPGVSIKELQNETISFLGNSCLEQGLIKEFDEIHNYYFHGISHHIGLDTHDPYPRYKGVLKPGMIISCEPGLYFENLGIGVRIEDDILVTEEGNENLSKDIIKEIDDIENFMAQFK